MEHIYLLPNGSKAPSMKAACEELNISSHAFRRLVKRGIVKRINSENDQSKKYGYEISAANSGRITRNWV
jgi:hypothetical protein